MPARALRRAARCALVDVQKMSESVNRTFHDGLRGTAQSDLKFASLLRIRLDLAAHALLQASANAVVAAYINDDVLLARIGRRAVEIRLNRVPAVNSERQLIFRVTPRTSRSDDSRVVYAEADLDASEASMIIPDFGVVTVMLPTRADGTLNDSAAVVVTAKAV